MTPIEVRDAAAKICDDHAAVMDERGHAGAAIAIAHCSRSIKRLPVPLPTTDDAALRDATQYASYADGRQDERADLVPVLEAVLDYFRECGDDSEVCGRVTAALAP